MSRRKGSSQRWRERQQADPFVEQARREGWRARAVYKLQEIDKRERILRRGATVVDLGASPGSWCQYVAKRIGSNGRIVAIDLLPMESLLGVEFIEGDFTDVATVEAFEVLCGAQSTDLVMSDMSPNISGNRAIDQPRSMQLADEALWFAKRVLRQNGDYLIKLFQGAGVDEYVRDVRSCFERVKLMKPRASRAGSREIYLLARRYLL